MWIDRASAARDAADGLLNRMGVRDPADLCPITFAGRLEIPVYTGGLSGAAARLTMLRGRASIRVPTDADSNPRVRFSVAHELGHYLLHKRSMPACTDEDLLAFHGDQTLEREANTFAAHLMMPPDLLLARFGPSAEPTIATADRVSATFRTSLTAAALALVDCTDYAGAVVMCKAGQVDWIHRNKWFGPRISADPPRAATTLAASVRGPATLAEPREVAPAAWLESPVPSGVSQLAESVAPMPRYDRSLNG